MPTSNCWKQSVRRYTTPMLTNIKKCECFIRQCVACGSMGCSIGWKIQFAGKYTHHTCRIPSDKELLCRSVADGIETCRHGWELCFWSLSLWVWAIRNTRGLCLGRCVLRIVSDIYAILTWCKHTKNCFGTLARFGVLAMWYELYSLCSVSLSLPFHPSLTCSTNLPILYQL